MQISNFPESLLEIAGPPDSWLLDKVGESNARVFYLPAIDAWLKCGSSGIGLEAEALRYLQGKASVSRLLHYQEENGVQYLLTTALPGQSLIGHDMLAQPRELVTILAEALRELHSLDISACPLDQRLSVKLRTWDLPHGERDWLDRNVPEEDLVFTHGDACLPNFCAENGRYTGCLDLADAGVADRWQDLSLSLWSLHYNLHTKAWGEPFLRAYGIEPDPSKIEYYLRLNQSSANVL